MEERILKSGHKLFEKCFIKDDIKAIKKKLKSLIKLKDINVIILSGGTGLTGRDSTPEAVKGIIKKEIPGFGEMFRMISYKKIATSSIQSKSNCVVLLKTNLFFFTGVSRCSCKDAWDNILVYQLNSNTRPCNLVELIPRLEE